jgi:ribosome-associated heat shock protein Hsp15
MIEGGKVRINGRVVKKPAAAVGTGDVLTIVHGERVRVVRVLGLPGRRGPAAEAQALYEESQESGVNSG